MYSLGLLSDEAVETGFAGPTLGLEFSGVVLNAGRATRGFNRGDRVVGFGPSSFSNRVIAKAASVSLVPDRISFEAAATIPSVFFTVFYSPPPCPLQEARRSSSTAPRRRRHAAIQIANGAAPRSSPPPA
jgi:NADPH:quinone reductase-like Zn-dependent oxidoreductase